MTWPTMATRPGAITCGHRAVNVVGVAGDLGLWGSGDSLLAGPVLTYTSGCSVIARTPVGIVGGNILTLMCAVRLLMVLCFPMHACD